MMNLRRSIKTALKQQGKNQEWLADRIGQGKSSVTVIMNRNATSSKTLERISAAFGMSVSEFIALGEKPSRTAHSASGDVS